MTLREVPTANLVVRCILKIAEDARNPDLCSVEPGAAQSRCTHQGCLLRRTRQARTPSESRVGRRISVSIFPQASDFHLGK